MNEYVPVVIHFSFTYMHVYKRYVRGVMLYNCLLIFMPEFPVTGLSVLCENVVRAMTYGLLLCLVYVFY